MEITIAVGNFGPIGVTGLEITDVLPSGLDYVSDTSGGAYNPLNGLWTIENLPAVPPNNLVSLQITVTVLNKGKILNIASINAHGISDQDLSNNSSAVFLNAGEQADLGLMKDVDYVEPFIGDPVNFVLSVTNNGPNDASGIQISDSMPTGLTYQASVASKGSYDVGTGIWNLGNLSVQEKATLNVEARATTEEQVTNTAIISQVDQFDPDGTSNTASVVVNPDMETYPSFSDLAVQLTANRSQADAGDQVVLTTVLRNHGPDDASNIQVQHALPEGVNFISAHPSQGNFDEATGLWSVGAIATDVYAMMDLVITLNDAAPKTFAASITGQIGFDPYNGNNSATVVVNTATTGICGDVNENDRLDIGDAMFIAQYLVGNRDESTMNLECGNVNVNDRIDIGDAMFIAQYLVGNRDCLCEGMGTETCYE